MSLMVEKLVRDFLKADEINDAILSQQIGLSVGNNILTSFINKIQNDISLMDKKEYTSLQDKISKIRIDKEPELKKINLYYDGLKSKDSYDNEDRKLSINNIQHEILQNILITIQGLLFNKGWIT